MPISDRVLLRCSRGYRLELDALVATWMQEGVKYVGVLGVDTSKVEDIIDELCVGDGSNPYPMLTACHAPHETIDDAMFLANQLSGDFIGEVRIVDL